MEQLQQQQDKILSSADGRDGNFKIFINEHQYRTIYGALRDKISTLETCNAFGQVLKEPVSATTTARQNQQFDSAMPMKLADQEIPMANIEEHPTIPSMSSFIQQQLQLLQQEQQQLQLQALSMNNGASTSTTPFFGGSGASASTPINGSVTNTNVLASAVHQHRSSVNQMNPMLSFYMNGLLMQNQQTDSVDQQQGQDADETTYFQSQ